MKNIAIIPARGGSKRIPKKNIKDFLGQPIISYSIQAALESQCFSEVMVSTDDEEIARIAKSYGASVPFLRSNDNSGDFATLADVVEETISNYRKKGEEFDYFCCILPTAPLTSSEKIKEGFKLIVAKKNNGVVPVVRFSYPIQRALKVENDELKMFDPESYNMRSQDLLPAYHDSGQFYWLKVDSFLKSKNFFAENTGIIELSEMEVQDIDTEEDWGIAELKYKIKNKLI